MWIEFVIGFFSFLLIVVCLLYFHSKLLCTVRKKFSTQNIVKIMDYKNMSVHEATACGKVEI